MSGCVLEIWGLYTACLALWLEVGTWRPVHSMSGCVLEIWGLYTAWQCEVEGLYTACLAVLLEVEALCTVCLAVKMLQAYAQCGWLCC